MQITDYLIEQQGIDWAAVLSEWAWLLPTDLTVWMVNRFGDIVFVAEDGWVGFLDIGAGTVSRIADSRDHFFALVDQSENADLWFLISLTDECVAAGMRPTASQCYGFKVAPIFDGKYVPENVEIADLVTNYRLLAQMHGQIKDLPDGTQVSLVLAASEPSQPKPPRGSA
jgi:hypothetical protein